jgi:uncharacterized protein
MTTPEFTIEQTAVTTAVGDLRAGIWVPADDRPRPGIVLVDGSGEGTYDDWGEWPDRYVSCGAVVLTHDKPGCGGSPGDWTTQSFADRAAETLAAVATLRKHPAVDGQPVGVLGVSQGGWISLLAAATDPAGTDFVITMSGPGVSPARQEHFRIHTTLTAAGLAPDQVDEAVHWVDERAERLRAGEAPESVLAAQQAYADRPWYAMTTQFIDTAAILGFVARIMDFDPADVLPQVRCPVFGAFGGADTLVPADESVRVYSQRLDWTFGNQHALAVFPGANHGLFTAAPDPEIPRTSQLAPGYLPMVAGFLERAARTYTSSAAAA